MAVVVVRMTESRVTSEERREEREEKEGNQAQPKAQRHTVDPVTPHSSLISSHLIWNPPFLSFSSSSSFSVSRCNQQGQPAATVEGIEGIEALSVVRKKGILNCYVLKNVPLLHKIPQIKKSKGGRAGAGGHSPIMKHVGEMLRLNVLLLNKKVTE